jgi:cation diffusion facilitator family transporter
MSDRVLHRHGTRVHSHADRGQHRHLHLALGSSQPLADPIGHRHDEQGQKHVHGLIDDSIKRSRDGLRAVLVALGILGLTAAVQTALFVVTGSVALLADLVHNFGDALTAVPLGLAFLARSKRAERRAGLVVVALIFASACVAAAEAVQRLVNGGPPDHLLVLGIAGGVGFLGNAIAARIRVQAGNRLGSPALVADGQHAHADALVSLGVIVSAVVVAVGVPAADPVIGLAMTLVILRIALQSWRIVREDR